MTGIYLKKIFPYGKMSNYKKVNMENKSIWNIGCGIVVAIIFAIILLATNDRGTLAGVGAGVILLFAIGALLIVSMNASDYENPKIIMGIIAAIALVLIILVTAIPEISLVLGILCSIGICCYIGYKIYKDLP